MNQDTEKETSTACNKWPFATKKLGIALVILSFLLYAGLLFVPTLPFSIGIKSLIGSALVILGEVAFWVGGFILGKDVIKKYKKYLNPLHWFKKDS